jgi:sarcosine oxidase, subunit alpha
MKNAEARTALHHWHVEHGARFVTHGNWQIPAEYPGVPGTAGRESEIVQNGAALVDLSALAKIRILGKGVADMARGLVKNDQEPKPGMVMQGKGNVPNLICCLRQDHLLLLGSTTTVADLDECLAELAPRPDVHRCDATTAYAGFCLVGTQLWAALPQLTSIDLRPEAFPPGSCVETTFAAVQALLVHEPRLGFPALRVYVAWDLAEFVWEKIVNSFPNRGLSMLGWEAWQMLVRG